MIKRCYFPFFSFIFFISKYFRFYSTAYHKPHLVVSIKSLGLKKSSRTSTHTYTHLKDGHTTLQARQESRLDHEGGGVGGG